LAQDSPAYKETLAAARPVTDNHNIRKC